MFVGRSIQLVNGVAINGSPLLQPVHNYSHQYTSTPYLNYVTLSVSHSLNHSLNK